jgi:DNA-directed RNA polymerase specialized sigma24 family protein
MRALGSAAAWKAVQDFDPARSVPRDAFIYGRVLSAMLTRYRQERLYGAHCLSEGSAEGTWPAAAREDRLPSVEACIMLHGVLACLSDEDSVLIARLYYRGHTEAEVARDLGLSQQAVSKRKLAVLRHLHGLLSAPREPPRMTADDRPAGRKKTSRPGGPPPHCPAIFHPVPTPAVSSR